MYKMHEIWAIRDISYIYYEYKESRLPALHYQTLMHPIIKLLNWHLKTEFGLHMMHKHTLE